jgi:hypothetical protein
MHLEFYAPIRLEAGDSVYFDARMGHAYVSASDEDANLLNICAGVNGEDLGHLINGQLVRRDPAARADKSNKPSVSGEPEP